MTKQERIEYNRKLVGFCIGHMIKYIKTEAPEKGKHRAQNFYYEEPVSKNDEK